MDATPPSSARALVFRALALLVFTAWVWQGPLRHALWNDSSPPSWNWVLFRDGGKDTCVIEYFERKGEKRERVERWKVLGYDAPYQMPRKLRVVMRRDLPSHHQRVCQALQKQRGGRVDLRAESRCATGDAWKARDRGDRNVCAKAKGKRP